MLESNFQRRVIQEIKEMFPGCIVLKNDATYIQGIPDLSIFYKDKWGMLEVKKSKTASRQPNQEYYVNKANEMSFAKFIYPENKEEVFRGLEQLFNKD